MFNANVAKLPRGSSTGKQWPSIIRDENGIDIRPEVRPVIMKSMFAAYGNSIGVGVIVAALSAGFAPRPVLGADGPAIQETESKGYKVDIIKDVPYETQPGVNKTRNRLDLYLPRGARSFPVLFFVHGGAWMMGDKDFLGLHHPIGIYFARHGIGVVMTNYRLAPAVHYPVQEQDVARAFAWTVKHIGKYHGRPDEIIALGHSAGGHLVALLGTDEKFLKEVGLSLHHLKGVICCSGVYQIPPDKSFFDAPFTTGPAVRRDASPIRHVRAGDPPFLLFCADKDLPYCGKRYAEQFRQALQAQHVPVEFQEIKGRTHNSCFLRAHSDKDPVAQAILAFVRAHTGEKTGPAANAP